MYKARAPLDVRPLALLQPVTYQVTLLCRDREVQASRFGTIFSPRDHGRNLAQHETRLRLILGRLNVSTSPQDMDLPGLHLHRLKGRRRNTWSVRVSGNWRITFRFDGIDATDVDYEDYH